MRPFQSAPVLHGRERSEQEVAGAEVKRAYDADASLCGDIGVGVDEHEGFAPLLNVANLVRRSRREVISPDEGEGQGSKTKHYMTTNFRKLEVRNRTELAVLNPAARPAPVQAAGPLI